MFERRGTSATLLGVASAVAMGYGVCVFWGFLATKTRTRIDIEIPAYP